MKFQKETIFTPNENDKMLEANKPVKDSFHNAIGPVLTLCQCFGLMPVSGVLERDTRKVRFRLLSFRCLLTLFTVIFTLLELFFSLLRSIQTKFDLGAGGAIAFYGTCLFGNLFFLKTAREWSKIIRYWRQTEDIFLREPYLSKRRRSLATQIRLVAFCILFLALCEHVLYIVSSLFNTSKQIELCHLKVNFVEHLFRRERDHIFRIIPYSPIFPLPIVYNTVAMTFGWTFNDVFIMIISIGVARRFNQINDRLETAYGKIMPESFWIEIRSHYLTVSELLIYIDKRLSSIILLSCANNLYFICFQLFNSFQEIPYVINNFYFWVALSFIIGRTMSMLFFAASVSDASRKPLKILRNVPSMAYTLEVQRFTAQVTFDRNAFSGKRFFFLTRKLILAMAGVVATYELVLLDEVQHEPSKAHICNDTFVIEIKDL